MPRQIGSHGWIDGYKTAVARYTSSPKQYHFWTAATAIAATLKRKVWVSRGTWKLHPNLFTILVGDPGIGKDEAINPAIMCVNEANTANVLSDRLTIEWIKETLAKGFQNAGATPTGGITFGIDSSCLLVAPELSVFLRFPEDELPDLADLWNAKQGKSMYGTRSKGLVTIDSPCPSLLGGCAPGWLKDAIPPSAVGGGFTRRVNFVWATLDDCAKNPWPLDLDWRMILNPLINDLRCIAQIRGEYKFDNLARPAFEKIFLDRPSQNDFADEATVHYHTSRWANTTKLAMCIAASKSDDLVITKEIFEEAEACTSKVKTELKSVFRSVGSSDMMAIADKIVRYIEGAGACTMQQLVAAMWRDCSRNELDVIIMTLRDGGILADSNIGGKSVYKLGAGYYGHFNIAMPGTAAPAVNLKAKAARYGVN